MKTWPQLLSRRCISWEAADIESCLGHDCIGQRDGPVKLGPLPPVAKGVGTQRLTKLLLNVHVEGSLGPVKVVMSPENDVADLVKAVVEIYVREKRRPLLSETHDQNFNLHYSQFSFHSLKRGEKLINLDSRNFYLCRKPTEVATSSYNNLDQSSLPLAKPMYFLL